MPRPVTLDRGLEEVLEATIRVFEIHLHRLLWKYGLE
jgi:hypothetical protein